MSEDDDYSDLRDKHAARTRFVAWVAIISLVLVGGGATVLTLLLG